MPPKLIKPPSTFNPRPVPPQDQSESAGDPKTSALAAVKRIWREHKSIVAAGIAGLAISVVLAFVAISLAKLKDDMQRLPTAEIQRDLTDTNRDLEALRRDINALREDLQALPMIRTELSKLRDHQGNLESMRNELAALVQASDARDRRAAVQRQSIEQSLSQLQEPRGPSSTQLMALLAQQPPRERKNFIAALAALEERPPSAIQNDMLALLPPKNGLQQSPDRASDRSQIPLPGEAPLIAVAVSTTSSRELASSESLQQPSEGSSEKPVPTDPAPRSSQVEEKPAKSEPSKPTVEYTIVPGDSLSKIAQKHSVSLRSLARANRISNPNKIRPGQILRIPRK